ncbi:Mbeg1-like protein [Anaerotignum sp.]
MTNMFDYLTWRGDLTLSQSPFQDVDSLILSTLAYVFFDGIVGESTEETVTIAQAAELYFARPRETWRSRVEEDWKLLGRLAESQRFAKMELCGYVNKLDFTMEKQFSALTILTGDGMAFVAYRGTDSSSVGWKEDFNMSFMDTVPAQQEAGIYLCQVAEHFGGKLRVGGHSKGGNLAVFAAAMCPAEVQARIVAVYNHDGPGFREGMLRRKGYRAILPSVQTFVPQSSVIGMLLEHEEEYIVIRSSQKGIMQHDPYSWEIIGKDFVRLEALTEESRLLDKTVKAWLNDLSEEQRQKFVDAVYEGISILPVDEFGEIQLSPKIALQALRTWGDEEEETKKIIGDSLKLLLQAAMETAREYTTLPKLGTWERRNEK